MLVFVVIASATTASAVCYQHNLYDVAADAVIT